MQMAFLTRNLHDDSFIQFSKFHNITNGVPIAIRFNYQSRFLYIFALDFDLTVTKSKIELFSEMFEDEKNNEFSRYDEDDSILFDCGLIKQGDLLRSILEDLMKYRTKNGNDQ